MELSIFWTNFAKDEIRKNFKYLKENASLRVAKDENRKIVLETSRLKKLPEIGQIEPRLEKQSKGISLFNTSNIQDNLLDK